MEAALGVQGHRGSHEPMQIIYGPIHDSSHTLDILLKQRQCDLVRDLSLSALSWSDHALVALRFAAPFCREAGSIQMVLPQELMDLRGFQELGISWRLHCMDPWKL